MSTFQEILNTRLNLWHMVYSRWISEELFSSTWFITVGSMIIIYTVLYLLIDRKRMRELFFYGSLLAVGFGYIDIIGNNMVLWTYKTHFIPFTPSLLPFTYTFHPIIHMLAYQYAPDWRTFAVTNTIASAIFAFVAQPFYAWVGVLWLEEWNYFYSFIIAGAISFFARAIVLWMANIEQSHVPETKRVLLNQKIQPAMKPLDKNDEDK